METAAFNNMNPSRANALRREVGLRAIPALAVPVDAARQDADLAFERQIKMDVPETPAAQRFAEATFCHERQMMGRQDHAPGRYIARNPPMSSIGRRQIDQSARPQPLSRSVEQGCRVSEMFNDFSGKQDGKTSRFDKFFFNRALAEIETREHPLPGGNRGCARIDSERVKTCIRRRFDRISEAASDVQESARFYVTANTRDAFSRPAQL